jgi:ribosomal protein S18 acetylase RimI-like enzyme
MNNELAAAIRVRKAKPEDVSSVCDLLFELKSMYASCSEEALEDFQAHYGPAIVAALDSETNSIWVAVTPEGQLAGFLSSTHRHVLRVAGTIGVMEEIYVRREFRNMGIGFQLWSHAIGDLRERGVEVMEVVTSLAHPGQRHFARKIGLEWYASIHRVAI